METEENIFKFASFLSGWIYFGCWSLTYYPQIYKNHKRRSVEGLSLDYLAYSTLGHVYYLIYNITIKYNKYIKEDILNQTGTTPHVKGNDVMFSLHAVVLCVIMCFQALLYGSKNRLSRLCIIMIVLGLILITGLGYAAHLGTATVTWGYWALTLGKIKVISTGIKYLPQIYLIYRQKHAKGLSFGSLVFDFSGGFFSILQIGMESIAERNYDEIKSFITLQTLSPKLALGTIVMVANFILYYQYYIYTDHKQQEKADYDEIVTLDGVLNYQPQAFITDTIATRSKNETDTDPQLLTPTSKKPSTQPTSQQIDPTNTVKQIVAMFENIQPQTKNINSKNGKEH